MCTGDYAMPAGFFTGDMSDNVCSNTCLYYNMYGMKVCTSSC